MTRRELVEAHAYARSRLAAVIAGGERPAAGRLLVLGLVLTLLVVGAAVCWPAVAAYAPR